jgi:hypothetical protein
MIVSSYILFILYKIYFKYFNFKFYYQIFRILLIKKLNKKMSFEEYNNSVDNSTNFENILSSKEIQKEYYEDDGIELIITKMKTLSSYEADETNPLKLDAIFKKFKIEMISEIGKIKIINFQIK